MSTLGNSSPTCRPQRIPPRWHMASILVSKNSQQCGGNFPRTISYEHSGNLKPPSPSTSGSATGYPDAVRHRRRLLIDTVPPKLQINLEKNHGIPRLLSKKEWVQIKRHHGSDITEEKSLEAPILRPFSNVRMSSPQSSGRSLICVSH